MKYSRFIKYIGKGSLVSILSLYLLFSVSCAEGPLTELDKLIVCKPKRDALLEERMNQQVALFLYCTVQANMKNDILCQNYYIAYAMILSYASKKYPNHCGDIDG